MKQSNAALKIEAQYEQAIPEKERLISVLADALLYLTPSYARGLDVKMRREVRRWISSEEVHACPVRGLSFAWICEQVGLNSQELRKQALKETTDLPELQATRGVGGSRENEISRAIHRCLTKRYGPGSRPRLILGNELTAYQNSLSESSGELD